MNRQSILKVAALIVLIGGGDELAAQSTPAKSPNSTAKQPTGEVGRYQLMSTQAGLLFLVDTTTGQCWNRSLDGKWHDAGNPTKMAPKKSTGEVKSESSLKLPEKSVEMTVIQREERAIPGSEGTVRLRLGDVTDGQAFLEVVAPGKTLLPRQSVRQGDKVEFAFNQKKYSVRVVELRNILIGDDFAKLTIEEVAADAAPPPEKKKAKKKASEKRPDVDFGDR